jgi:uncharacterized protein YcbX
MLQIDRLRIHPVAGMGGMDVSEIEVDKEGVRKDRIFTLVELSQINNWLRSKSDSLPVRLTQKAESKLVFFSASEVDGKLKICFRGEELQTKISVTRAKTTLPFVSEPEEFLNTNRTLLGAVFPFKASSQSKTPRWGVDCGDGVAEWISRRLGRGCRLLRAVEVDESEENPTPKPHFTWYSFPHAVLMNSVAALGDEVGQNISPELFRPNVIISGGEKFDEEFWARVAIADIPFLISYCLRCGYLNIDSQTAERTNQNILGTLVDNHQTNFGVYLHSNEPVTLQVGQQLRVLERRKGRGEN